MPSRRSSTTTVVTPVVLLISLLLVACGAATPAAPETGSNDVVAPTAETAAEEAAVESVEPAEPAEPETVVITHAQGETTVTKNPQTVVVFDYSALDTLDHFNIPVAGVPQATLPPFLSKYSDTAYANVGTLFEPDYEKVNDLKPDLIIVGGRSAAVYPELSKIAPTIDVTIDSTTLIPDFKAAITNLGIIFDKEAEVVKRVNAIDEAIANVNELATSSGKSALIVMTTGGEVTAFGPGSRFGLIHDVLGVPPIVADVESETHGDAISFEFILEKNPDILFVIDRDAAIGQGTEAAEQVMDNELMHSTKAWQNDGIVYLNPATWYLASGGVTALGSMIGEIQQALQ